MVTWAWIVVLLLGVMLVTLLVAGVVVLVVNPKTRPVMLGLLATVAVIAILLVSFYFISIPMQRETQIPQQYAELLKRGEQRTERWEVRTRPIYPDGTVGPPMNVQRPRDTEEESPAPPQPDWVDGPEGLQEGVYRAIAVSDPYTTRQECEVAIGDQLLQVTRGYLQRLGGPLPDELPVDLAYVRQEICQDEWVEVLDSSVGPMRRLHVLMEFDRNVAEQLKDRLHAALVRQRLMQAGWGAVLVLGIVGTVFGYLTLDTATKGYYTRRLQLAAAGAILALVAVVVAA